LHALALTKPGVTSAADALQYVPELHKVMMSDPYWRYKHSKRSAGSVAIPWQQWFAEAESCVPTLDADRAGKPRRSPPGHDRDADLLASAAEDGEHLEPSAGAV